MGFPGFLLPPWRKDYVTDDQPAPVTPSPPPSPVLTAAPQASGDSGGGFWGGLLGILKNVPITIGDTRKGHVQNLGSYNKLMAGRDLAQWGRDQGLEMQGLGDFPNPDVARFAVQQGLERREKAPIGMETINRLFPVQPGEDPRMAQSRAMLAQVPQHQWGPLLGHLVTQYGLPGFGGESVLDPYAAVRYLPTDDQPPSTALPQPQASPSAGTAPSTAPLATQAPAAAVTTPPPMPSTAPLVAPPGSTGAPGLPQAPAAPRGRVTQQQVLQHPTVTAAKAAYDASRTLQEKRQNALALRTALQQAPYKIQQEEHLHYKERSEEYRNTLAAQKAYQEAVRAPYGYGGDLDAQIRMDYNHPSPDDPRLPEMARASEPRLAERLARNRAQETEAARTATLTAERTHQVGLPLYVTQKERGTHWYDVRTGTPLNQEMPTGQAEQLERQGQARQVSEEDHKDYKSLQDAAVIMREGTRLTNQVYDILDGYLGQMTPAERANPLQWMEGHLAQVMQEHPELIQTQRFWDASLQTLARGIGSARGDLSSQELAQSSALVPKIGYLLRAIGVKGAFGGGFNVQLPSQQVPDTREVALRTIDNTTRLLNGRAARILGNPAFQFPELTPRGEAQYGREREEQRRRAERTPSTPLPPDLALEKKVAETVGGAVKQGVQKAKAFLTPGAPASPATATMEQVRSTALKQHGLTAPPNPHQDPQGFQAFMTTVREQVRRYQPNLSPAQQDQLTGLIAQRYGGTWQPHP